MNATRKQSIVNVNLELIEEYAVAGLNSEHWEAALQDILDLVRRTKDVAALQT